MRKIIHLLLVLSLCFLGGCSDILKEYQSISEENELMMSRIDTIVNCFDEKNADELKQLLAPQLQRLPDIDQQIQTAFSMYNGKSQSYDYTRTAMAGGGRTDGVWVDKHFCPLIDNICTDTGDVYSIAFGEYTVYEKDASYIGITVITLLDANDELIAIIE